MQTILYVADLPASLFSLSLVLNSNGYCCITAEDPDMATRLHQKHWVDMIIADHNVGGFPGCEVTACLKKIVQAPVILLSGNSELKEKPACADLLLPNPVNPEELLSQIATLLPASPELPAL